jgi:hypothetical protein
MVLQPISLPYAVITGADAVQLRRDRVDAAEAAARARASRRGSPTDPAAVVHFGAQAISLARSTVTPNAGATTSDVFEMDEANPAPTPPTAFAPNPDATLPRAPAVNDAETAPLRAPAAESADAAPSAFVAEELNPQQQRQLQTLAQNEHYVRADANAQRAAAGGYASGVQLRYEVGPDGRRYVVDAEVLLDVTPVAGDPAATLRKMELIMRAAISGNDRNAAAEAGELARRARAQLAAQRYAEAREFSGRT